MGIYKIAENNPDYWMVAYERCQYKGDAEKRKQLPSARFEKLELPKFKILA